MFRTMTVIHYYHHILFTMHSLKTFIVYNIHKFASVSFYQLLFNFNQCYLSKIIICIYSPRALLSTIITVSNPLKYFSKFLHNYYPLVSNIRSLIHLYTTLLFNTFVTSDEGFSEEKGGGED